MNGLQFNKLKSVLSQGSKARLQGADGCLLAGVRIPQCQCEPMATLSMSGLSSNHHRTIGAAPSQEMGTIKCSHVNDCHPKHRFKKGQLNSYSQQRIISFTSAA
ncbi:hypothetical protein XELAEV_18013425mg [Xenopus laevis]|uniref:Uncharacterized protein n=1 Tax=Xenopus laevis TaxID=8355 RepID=A0A974DPM9_XENLA|nr:hypothetical protein XELAEV_18013425mg [Xenopus laevis]